MDVFAGCSVQYLVGRGWGGRSFPSRSWLGKGDDEPVAFVIVIPCKERRIVGPHRQHYGWFRSTSGR